MTQPPLQPRADTAQTASRADEAALREIEALVREVVFGPPADRTDVPELEAVARDLGISVEALHAIRETALG